MRFSQTNKPPLGSQINWSHPLAKGLIGCWLMNEGSGNRLYDLSQNENHGLFMNALKWDASSRIKTDGNTAYVVSLNANKLPTVSKPRTISVWFCRFVDTGTYEIICGYGTGSNVQLFSIAISNTDYLGVACYGDDYYPTAPGTQPINVWTHAVGVYDGAARFLYKNGVLVGSLSGGINTTLSANNFFAGNLPPNFFGFNGLVDNIIFYERALSAQEVSKLYQSPYAMFEHRPYWMDYTPAAGTATPVFMHHYKIIRNSA